MTRKRFIKLLMAEGCSRNRAHELCQLYMCHCESYDKAYKKRLKVKSLGKAISKSGEAAKKATLAFMDMAGAFYRALGKQVVEG